MWRWEDVKMWGCEDEKMWRWEDVKVWGCECVKMMRKCEDEKMWGWEHVKMRRCEDEKMWRWEDVRMRRWETDPHYWKNPALRRSREKNQEFGIQKTTPGKRWPQNIIEIQWRVVQSCGARICPTACLEKHLHKDLEQGAIFPFWYGYGRKSPGIKKKNWSFLVLKKHKTCNCMFSYSARRPDPMVHSELHGNFDP